MIRMRSFWLVYLLCVLFLPGCLLGTTYKQKKRARSLLKLGIHESNQGQFRRALAILIQAEQADDQNYWVQEALGGTYMRMGQFEHALTHFRRALKISPRSPRGWNNLGSAYMALRRWKMAVNTLQKAVDNLLYQTPCIALANLGWAYQKIKKPQQALKYLARTLKECPRLCQGHRMLGKVYYAQKKLEQARQSFYRYTLYCKKFPEGFFLLANTELQLKRYRDAVRTSRRCLKLTEEKPAKKRACYSIFKKAQTKVASYVP